MLRPQDTATRETKRLDGRWAFALDPEGVGRSEGWFAGPLRDARAMPVPASFNDICRGRLGPRLLRGRLVPARRPGTAGVGRPADRPALRVGHAPGDGVGRVHEVVSHEGGYTPFAADVSSS